MKCLRHGKDAEYQCQWCGKQICELCVGKKDGRKVHCHDCVAKLAGLKPEKLPKIEKKPEEKRPKIQDGYLILEEDREWMQTNSKK